MSGFYDDDLAYVHHTGFRELAERGGAEILALLRAGGITSGLVVDLGCGSGMWARRLTESGYEALGIDVSPAMIRLARETAPRAEFRSGSLHHAAIPPCAAVTALGEALNYGAERVASERLGGVFRKVAGALSPGGLFAFDLVVQGEPALDYRSWTSGPDWAVLVAVSEEPGRLLREITVFRDAGAGYRRSEERHALLVPRAEEVEALLRSAGFRFRAGTSYGAYALPPRRRAFVARKLA